MEVVGLESSQIEDDIQIQKERLFVSAMRKDKFKDDYELLDNIEPSQPSDEASVAQVAI